MINTQFFLFPRQNIRKLCAHAKFATNEMRVRDGFLLSFLSTKTRLKTIFLEFYMPFLRSLNST